MDQKDYRELRDRISAGFSENQEHLAQIRTAVLLADQKLDTLTNKSEDQEKRIRALEGWRMKILGIATAAGTGLSFVVNKLFGVAG